MSNEFVYRLIESAVVITVLIVSMRWQIKDLRKSFLKLGKNLNNFIKFVKSELISIGEKLEKHEKEIKDLHIKYANIISGLERRAGVSKPVEIEKKEPKFDTPRQRAIKNKK